MHISLTAMLSTVTTANCIPLIILAWVSLTRPFQRTVASTKQWAARVLGSGIVKYCKVTVYPRKAQINPALYRRFDAISALPSRFFRTQSQAVTAGREEVIFNLYASLVGGLQEKQRIFNRYAIIWHSVPQKSRWGVAIHKTLHTYTF